MDLESAADRLLNTLLLHAKGKPEDDVTFMLIDP
jgi:hypothetical protein